MQLRPILTRRISLTGAIVVALFIGAFAQTACAPAPGAAWCGEANTSTPFPSPPPLEQFTSQADIDYTASGNTDCSATLTLQEKDLQDITGGLQTQGNDELGAGCTNIPPRNTSVVPFALVLQNNSGVAVRVGFELSIITTTAPSRDGLQYVAMEIAQPNSQPQCTVGHPDPRNDNPARLPNTPPSQNPPAIPARSQYIAQGFVIFAGQQPSANPVLLIQVTDRSTRLTPSSPTANSDYFTAKRGSRAYGTAMQLYLGANQATCFKSNSCPTR